MSGFAIWRGLLPLTLALAPMAAAPTPAHAQERVGGRTVYDAAFFTQFAPTSALQVVQRVPGFRLEDTDQDVRGFGQAAGNVVINGARPSAKSDSLETILAQIPAARVLRVEVGPGDGFGAEFAGRPQVLNLVLTADSGLAGTTELRLRRPYVGRVRADGKASALLKRGQSSFRIAADYNNDELTDFGPDILTSLPDGTLLERRDKHNGNDDPEGNVSLGWSHEDGEDRRANLNLRYAQGRFRLWQSNHVQPANGTVRDDRLEQDFRYRQFELGGDITRPLGDGSVKLILLATRTSRDREELVLNGVGDLLMGGMSQLQNTNDAESVVRLVWSRPSANGWSIEAGGEAVLNRLDSEVELSGILADGGTYPIPLPLANAVVREIRLEPFVNLGRQLAPGLRADFGLTFERSRLTVSGDADAERTLSYLKPRASLDWRSGRWLLQARAERTVAQLNFGDFISLAEFSNERVNGGNADLVPQRAWEFLATAERPFLGSGVIRAELGINFVQQVQDRVPMEDGLDAPGNLGSGRMKIARLNMDAPLTSLGIPGGRATMRLSIVDTNVRDPYTLRNRHFTNYTLWVLDVGFRQDLGRFAWGFDTWSNSGSTQYRRTEEDRNYRGNPYVEAFAEYRPDSRTILTLRAENLLDVNFYRERTFFSPDRSSTDPVMREHRKRQEHITPSLTLKRTFG
ncbi:MAG: hypothetical protein DI568_04415 [Sphingomonas sp.]|nr:MAG: hypothetical protein DI568_04415 [Sphingomonas sp.]